MVREKYIKRMDHLRDVMFRISGIDPLEDSRRHDVVTAKMMLAAVLQKEGCNIVQTGRLLGRTHATVIHYNDMFLALFLPGWEAERELWEKFKKEI